MSKQEITFTRAIFLVLNKSKRKREEEKKQFNIGMNYCIKCNLFDIDRPYFSDVFDKISFGAKKKNFYALPSIEPMYIQGQLITIKLSF